MSGGTYTGIVTHQGREITLDSGVPGLYDIALALSRQPRFGGHTRCWWSVLDHTLFMEELAAAQAKYRVLNDISARSLRIAALFHDAHEALTADVPTPFKSDALRSTQNGMDVRIMDAYLPGGYVYYDAALAAEIKKLDYRALLIEAEVMGPDAFRGQQGMWKYFGNRATGEERSLLECRMGFTPEHLTQGVEAPIVRCFVERYLDLR